MTELIGLEKPLKVSLEVPAVFNVTLFFINHEREYTTVNFALPPGVYPNPEWLEDTIKDAYRQSLKALVASTKNLSWRKCSTQEFVRATSPAGQKIEVDKEWQKAYSTKMKFEKLPEAPDTKEVTNDNNSVSGEAIFIANKEEYTRLRNQHKLPTGGVRVDEPGNEVPKLGAKDDPQVPVS